MIHKKYLTSTLSRPDSRYSRPSNRAGAYALATAWVNWASLEVYVSLLHGVPTSNLILCYNRQTRSYPTPMTSKATLDFLTSMTNSTKMNLSTALGSHTPMVVA